MSRGSLGWLQQSAVDALARRGAVVRSVRAARTAYRSTSVRIGSSADVLAYDPARKALVLVTAPELATGSTRVIQPSTTWTWTGAHWREMLGNGPGWGTTGALMAYDPATNQLVFAPNNRPDTSDSSTYVLGASGWLREPKSPLLSWMAYDPVTGRLLAENGADGSMWWWTGKRWQLVTHHVVVRLQEGSYKGILVEGANWVTDQSARLPRSGGWTSCRVEKRTRRAGDRTLKDHAEVRVDLLEAHGEFRQRRSVEPTGPGRGGRTRTR